MVNAKVGRRASRKERKNSKRPETTHKCDFCGRDCFSHIGLCSHKRRRNSRTDRTTRMFSHDQTWSTEAILSNHNKDLNLQLSVDTFISSCLADLPEKQRSTWNAQIRENCLTSRATTRHVQCWAHRYWWQEESDGLVIAVLASAVWMNDIPRSTKELPSSLFSFPMPKRTSDDSQRNPFRTTLPIVLHTLTVCGVGGARGGERTFGKVVQATSCKLAPWCGSCWILQTDVHSHGLKALLSS